VALLVRALLLCWQVQRVDVFVPNPPVRLLLYLPEVLVAWVDLLIVGQEFAELAIIVPVGLCLNLALSCHRTYNWLFNDLHGSNLILTQFLQLVFGPDRFDQSGPCCRVNHWTSWVVVLERDRVLVLLRCNRSKVLRLQRVRLVCWLRLVVHTGFITGLLLRAYAQLGLLRYEASMQAVRVVSATTVRYFRALLLWLRAWPISLSLELLNFNRSDGQLAALLASVLLLTL